MFLFIYLSIFIYRLTQSVLLQGIRIMVLVDWRSFNMYIYICVCGYVYVYVYVYVDICRGTPGLHNKIPAHKIFARVWVAQEPICSLVAAKIFQGLGPKRRKSCDGDRV